MTDLRKAAEMALEDICGAKLCEVNSMSSRAEMLRLMDKAAEALRQALAQPVDAVSMSQERVDETVKREHEWKGLDGEIPGLGLVTEEFYNGMLFAEDILREKNT